MLLRKIQKNNIINDLKQNSSPVLVGVSGGVDSMVLCDLLIKLNIHFSIAHCNFKLRKEAADQDELFVNNFATKNKIKCHNITFNTVEYANNNGISIQMAARDLRYDWFETLVKEHQYSALLVAHHLDDQLETLLINLGNSTGIKGLTGMQSKRDYIFRPLLDFSKSQILEYAQENRIEYKEDASNAENKYERNHIRNKVVPELKKNNENFLENVKKTIENLQSEQNIIQHYLNDFKHQHVQEIEDTIIINKVALKNSIENATVLHHIIKGLGFSPKELYKMIDCLNTSGKQFNSRSHCLRITKGEVVIKPI